MGAVTWGNGTTGIVGAVSASNSLIGTTANDKIGSGGSVSGGVVALSNGNYVSGQKKEKDAKVQTAKTMWVPAVNNLGTFGRWAFLEIDGSNLHKTKQEIRRLVKGVGEARYQPNTRTERTRWGAGVYEAIPNPEA